MNKVLEIKDLSYSYKSEWLGKPYNALKDINLDLHEGECFGFLGHNGAGKTTTIKCILSLTRIKSGSIKIFGKEHSLAASRENVGYLPEQPYFYDYLTVNETMELYATLAGVNNSDLKTAVREALDLVKISSRAKNRMRTLSKGLTQRVAMAQAIVAKPKLLILDEPFSGLDPIGRKEFRELISNLNRSGVAIFMSSHILSDVEDLCGRASIMASGELKGIYNLKDGSLKGSLEDLFMRLVAFNEAGSESEHSQV